MTSFMGFKSRNLMDKKSKQRCEWARDPLNIVYHDEEWGRPVHDDKKLFEFLILEGAQAGLIMDNNFKKEGQLS